MHSPPQPLRDFVRYVFLDRDGVINRKMPEGRYVTSTDELELCHGAAAAISRLNEAGIKVVTVTNQRGIALGLCSEEELAEIHRHLQALLAPEGAHLDAIYYCPHDRVGCDCRKPKPGMFLQAFRDFPGCGPENSLMVGDSLSDIEAARNLGMTTVFIDGDPATQPKGSERARELSTYRAPSLLDFVAEHWG